MQTLTRLPAPSSTHAICAWCAAEHSTVIELIDHVDEHHLGDKRNVEAVASWTPTPEEVAAILAEMRPIIDRFAARDRRRLIAWAAAA